MYYMKQPPIPEDDERRVFLRVPPNVHDALTRLAKEDDRSLNNYLNRVLFEYVVNEDAL